MGEAGASLRRHTPKPTPQGRHAKAGESPGQRPSAQRTSTSAAGKSVRLSSSPARAWAAVLARRPSSIASSPSTAVLERGSRIGAVAPVPAERGGSKERWLPGKDQEGEFEGLGETDVLELDRISASCCKVSRVERSAETSISRAAGGHTNTCSQKAGAVADRSEADIGDLDTDAGLRFGWSSGRRTVRSAAGTTRSKSLQGSSGARRKTWRWRNRRSVRTRRDAARSGGAAEARRHPV